MRGLTLFARWLPIVACTLAAAAPVDARFQDKPAKKNKPSVVLRASPAVGFVPARVVVTAEIVGGPDDYADFYCASVEWDWGDDTRSEERIDCDPYEPGKSQIKRRFVANRVFNLSGEFRIVIRLKQKNKVVGMASTDVRIRGGRDGDDRQ